MTSIFSAPLRKVNPLFEVFFLLRFESLASKSVFVVKFACAYLAAKFMQLT